MRQPFNFNLFLPAVLERFDIHWQSSFGLTLLHIFRYLLHNLIESDAEFPKYQKMYSFLYIV